MADNDDTPAKTDKPAPRRRSSRKTDGGAAKSSAAKRASRPATAAPKKAAAAKPRAVEQPETTTDHARVELDKAAKAVGGRRNAGLIAAGFAVASVAAAALFSLRSSTPKKGGARSGAKAHQPDGTDSSAQMDAMIADESMIPDSTPKG